MEDDLVFQKVEIRRFPSRTEKSRDGSYWKGFGVKTAKQTGGVTALDFAPNPPHTLAATSGTRVVLYNIPALRSPHAITKFKDLAHGASFRHDSQLLTAGTEEGTAKVFRVADRAMLREFHGHKRAVHVAQFSFDGLRVMTGSDDTTVRMWDLAEGKQIGRMDGHRDYVRCGRRSRTSVDLWATGGYDHVCRIWDVRQRADIYEFDHGAPIESLAFLPSGTVVATAGGPYVCLWDVLGSGKMLRKIEAHHKTVTSIDTIHTESHGTRLLSASLDQHVKIYDLADYKIVHDARYKQPILSVAASPDGENYAVGMSNGTIVLRHDSRQPPSTPAFIDPSNKTMTHERIHLKGFNNLLRKFRYKDALNLVLKQRDVRAVSAVVEELAARDGLIAALNGRSVDDLMSLLSYIDIHIGNPIFTDHVTPLLEILLDLYETDLAVDPLRKKLDAILRSLQRELGVLVEMKELKGGIEAVLGSTWNMETPKQDLN